MAIQSVVVSKNGQNVRVYKNTKGMYIMRGGKRVYVQEGSGWVGDMASAAFKKAKSAASAVGSATLAAAQKAKELGTAAVAKGQELYAQQTAAPVAGGSNKTGKYVIVNHNGKNIKVYKNTKGMFIMRGGKREYIQEGSGWLADKASAAWAKTKQVASKAKDAAVSAASTVGNVVATGLKNMPVPMMMGGASDQYYQQGGAGPAVARICTLCQAGGATFDRNSQILIGGAMYNQMNEQSGGSGITITHKRKKYQVFITKKGKFYYKQNGKKVMVQEGSGFFGSVVSGLAKGAKALGKGAFKAAKAVGKAGLKYGKIAATKGLALAKKGAALGAKYGKIAATKGMALAKQGYAKGAQLAKQGYAKGAQLLKGSEGSDNIDASQIIEQGQALLQNQMTGTPAGPPAGPPAGQVIPTQQGGAKSRKMCKQINTLIQYGGAKNAMLYAPAVAAMNVQTGGKGLSVRYNGKVRKVFNKNRQYYYKQGGKNVTINTDLKFMNNMVNSSIKLAAKSIKH